MRHTLTAALLTLLCACGTSPPVHYYTLSEPAAASVAKTGTTIVAIGPFTVPDYLQKPYIVIRESDQRMRFAEYHRWVEAPQDALVAWLARDVDQQLGTAVLVVQWDCRSRDGTPLLALRTSRYTAKARKADDYSSIVQALNATVADFGRDIVAALTTALPATRDSQQQ